VKTRIWLAALALALGMSTPAWAQRTLMSYGAVNPNSIVNQPIDMSQAIAPPPTPVMDKPFALTNFFPRIALPGIRQRMGVSPLPAPNQFPSTQYKNGYVVPTPSVPKQ
jgi:hypothetical protein